MARINTVNKAAKDVGRCLICGHDIKKGEAYKWFKPFRSSKRVACSTCNFRRSHTCTSKWSTIYSAIESLEATLSSWDDYDISTIETEVEELRDAVEEVRDEYQDALDQWEHGNEQLQEKVDSLEDWDIDPCFDDRPDFEEDDYEDFNEEQQAEWDSWRDSVISECEDLISDCPGEC